MKKENKIKEPMLPEYDFSSGIRGKYADRYMQGVNIVRLEPDIADIFPDQNSVNEALRAMAKVIRKHDRMMHYSEQC